MASRNGLNPKIRGPKGVGFGRALPAPFGFDNGVNFNGQSNPHFAIPHLVGQNVLSALAIEYWFNYRGAESYLDGVFSISGSTGGESWLCQQSGSMYFVTISGGGNYAGEINASMFRPSKNHIVFNIDNVKGATVSLNYSDPSGLREIPYMIGPGYLPTGVITFFNFFGVPSQGAPGSQFYDEFRLYKSVLPTDQIIQNYNNGVGNNPSITENLLAWFIFEKFEMLDFSADQDGSNMQMGIRDMSGNNNHALPVNIITDPSNASYALKPF